MDNEIYSGLAGGYLETDLGFLKEKGSRRSGMSHLNNEEYN
jgi:hypothetical protein